jgi:hypothetical protein
VDLPFARWRGLDWFALGLVLLAVWSSTLPWFGRSVALWSGTTHSNGRFDANAWQAATHWSVAIVIVVVAGAAWLALRAAGRAGRWTGAASALIVGYAIWLSMSRWISIPGPGRPRFVIVVTRVEPGLVLSSPAQLYAVHRDRLNIAHYTGYSADVRYGLYLSLALMSALLLVILTESVRWRVPELPWLSG